MAGYHASKSEALIMPGGALFINSMCAPPQFPDNPDTPTAIAGPFKRLRVPRPDMTNITSPESLTKELERIQSLLSAEELQEAATALNAVQRTHPRDARLYLLGMRLGRQAGNIGGAIQAGRKALQIAPTWPTGQMEMALTLSGAGQHDEAMALASKAISQDNTVDMVRWGLQVALAAGQEATATRWTRQIVQLDPTNSTARLALVYRLIGQDANSTEAAALLDQLSRESPDDVNVVYARATVARRQGRDGDARVDAETMIRLSPDNPVIRDFHALAHGQTPATQAESTVAALFDAYAPRFDQSLWGDLQYRLPRQVADILLRLHPDRKFSVLDLGCGTGLVGLFLGPLEGHIIGVDLSIKMIEQAAKHNVYSRFYHVNILNALTATPAEHYEAITCADALVYVGDLSPVIPGALRILKPDGHFIFSCEAAAEEETDLVLRKSDRYAHKQSHVERLCRDAGFDEVHIEYLPSLRMEGGTPLPGFLVTAHKPVAS